MDHSHTEYSHTGYSRIDRSHMEHYHEVLSELREPTTSLRQAIPEVWAGFASLHEAAMTGGVVPARLKEAVALAIAAVKGCDGCIAYHAKAAARAGATRAEVAELLGVALLMDGGTASVHAPRAFAAFHEFEVGVNALATLVRNGGERVP